MSECYIWVSQRRDSAGSNTVLRIPCYCVLNLTPIPLGFALVFSTIYHRVLRTPRYVKLISVSLAYNQPR